MKNYLKKLLLSPGFRIICIIVAFSILTLSSEQLLLLTCVTFTDKVYQFCKELN